MNKTAEGAGSEPAPNKSAGSTPMSSEVDRGENLLGTVQASDSDKAAKSSQASADGSKEEPKSASSKEEPSGSDAVSDPDSWTRDSAFKEIKRLREENKSTRLKYGEQLDSFKSEYEAKVQKQLDELKGLVSAKEELDSLKAREEDKKRDLGEKLVHREQKLQEYQTLFDQQQKEHEEKVQALKIKLGDFEAQVASQKQMYENRLSEEIDKIPEKYKEYAGLIVKGSGDPRDALIALNEAKLKGMFEDKTVVVNHSVPGAQDGARSTKQRMDEVANEKRSSMSGNDKIKAGLDDIFKNKQPNTVFRTK